MEPYILMEITSLIPCGTLLLTSKQQPKSGWREFFYLRLKFQNLSLLRFFLSWVYIGPEIMASRFISTRLAHDMWVLLLSNRYSGFLHYF